MNQKILSVRRFTVHAISPTSVPYQIELGLRELVMHYAVSDDEIEHFANLREGDSYAVLLGDQSLSVTRIK